MSRAYQFDNKEGLYFVSFATVSWIDVFTRQIYFDCAIESLDFCRKEKGMSIYAYCIMTNHIHLVFRAEEANPGALMRCFKTFTSKKLQSLIEENVRESRRVRWLSLMKQAGYNNSNIKNRQFWQQGNHAIELWSKRFIDQKVGYIHKNPVVAGFVVKEEDWKYSSAIDYAGGKGPLEIDFL